MHTGQSTGVSGNVCHRRSNAYKLPSHAVAGAAAAVAASDTLASLIYCVNIRQNRIRPAAVIRRQYKVSDMPHGTRHPTPAIVNPKFPIVQRYRSPFLILSFHEENAILLLVRRIK